MKTGCPVRLLSMALALLATPSVLMAAGCEAAGQPWWRSADWIAAIGQVGGAVFTAVAAGFAWRALRATQRAAETQVMGATVASLMGRYADPTLYESLQRFGRFMGDDVGADRRGAIGKALDVLGDKVSIEQRYGALVDYKQKRESLEQAIPESLDKGRQGLRWVMNRLGYDASDLTIPAHPNAAQLIADRRMIHHHFKMVWAAMQAGVLSRQHLRLVTDANYGYELWRFAVLPVTLAMGKAQRRADAGPKAESWDVRWVWDLIELVEDAPPIEPIAPGCRPPWRSGSRPS